MKALAGLLLVALLPLQLAAATNVTAGLEVSCQVVIGSLPPLTPEAPQAPQALYDYLRPRKWTAARGVNLVLGRTFGADGSVLPAPRQPAIEDWGLTFVNLAHLHLRDSSISGVPLSPVAPLLQCLHCGRVSVNGLELTSLAGGLPPLPAAHAGECPAPDAAAAALAGQRTPAYGALHVTGASAVQLQGFTCEDVMEAHGFACAQVELVGGGAEAAAGGAEGAASGAAAGGAAAMFSCRNCSLQRNRVAWGAPELDAVTGDSAVSATSAAGRGAIVLSGAAAATGLDAGADVEASVHVHVDVDVELSDCVFDSNRGGAGAALSTDAGVRVGSLVIARTNLTNNVAELGSGGALLLEGGLGSLTVRESSDVSSNSAAGFGGAVAVGAAFTPGFSLPVAFDAFGAAGGMAAGGGGDGMSELLVESSKVAGNRASLGGGAVFLNGSLGAFNVSGAGSSVSGNGADWGSGGAMLVAGGLGSMALAGGGDAACTLCGNTAYDSGGAVHVSSGSSTSTSSSSSSSTDTSGGVAAGTNIEIREGARVEDNAATNGAGGALSLTGTIAAVRVAGAGTSLLRNTAATTGGAVAVRQGGVAGAITLADGAVVANCNARKGGAFKVDGDVGALAITGGARLDQNSAGRGSGGGTLIDGRLGSLILSGPGSSVSQCYAFLRGGGVYAGGGLGSAVVEAGAVMEGNTAQFSGGALGVDGGLDGLAVRGAGSSVSRNNASMDAGGGVWVRGDLGDLEVGAGAALAGNFAYDSGGAIYVSGGVGGGGGGGGVRVLDGGAIDGNRVMRSRGGGVAVRGNLTSLTLARRGSISGNAAGDTAPPLSAGAAGHMPMAGGVWVGGVVGWIRIADGSRLSSNTARKGGGALYIGNPDAAPGQGSGHVGSLELSNGSCICDNLSGVIPDDGSRHAVVFIAGRAGSIRIQNSSVSRNRVLYGDSVSPPFGTTHGGALLAWQGVGAFLATAGSDLSDNAGGDGAVLCVPEQPPVSAAAAAAAAAAGSTSAAVLAIGEFVLEGSRMDRNAARGDGGALWSMGRVGAVRIAGGSSVSGNRAGGIEGGGAVFLGLHLLANVTVADSTVAANVAAYGSGGFLLHRVNATGAEEVAARLPPPSTDSAGDSSPPASVLSLLRSNVSDNVAVKDGGAFLFDLNVSVPVLDASAAKPASAAAAAAAAALAARPGPPLLQMRVEDSELSGNWARIGAGGAVALLNTLPVAAVPGDSGSSSGGSSGRSSSGSSGGGGGAAALQAPQPAPQPATTQQQRRRLADVSLGFELLISGGSRLLRNRAGDDSVRFEQSVDDVSALAGNGGALFLWAQPATVTVAAGSTATNGTAPGACGGAAERQQQQQLALLAAGRGSEEGVVAWPAGSGACRLYLESASVRDNRATGGYGGGAATVNCAVAVRRSRFEGNSATLRGGGLAFADYGLPPEAVAAVQQAPCGGGGGGGALANVSGTAAGAVRRRLLQQQQPQAQQVQRMWLDVSRSAFVANSAADGGGGLFLEANATSAARLADCSLAGNSVPREGGGALIVVAAPAAPAAPAATGNGSLASGVAATAGTPAAIAGTPAVVPVAVLRVNCSGNNAGEAGGCLALRPAAPGAAVAVQGLRAEANTAGSGAGVSVAGVRGSAITARGCSFDGNVASTRGGGWATGPSFAAPAANAAAGSLSGATDATAAMSVRLTGCSFKRNQALLNGGGVAFVADPAVASSLRGCNFTSNTASSSGGGLAVDGSLLPGGSVVVSGCSFDFNEAVSGGAAYVLAAADGSNSNNGCGGQLQLLDGSTLTSNVGGWAGGAVMVEVGVSSSSGGSSSTPALAAGSSSSGSATSNGTNATGACLLQPALRLQDAVASFNAAPLGAAVFVGTGATAIVNNSRLLSNRAAISGGAVAAIGCRALRVTGCDVLGGDARLSGGGVFVDSCGLAVVDRSTLLNNSASAGGGIHLSGLRPNASTGASSSSSGSSSSSSSSSGTSSSNGSSSGWMPVALLHKLSMAGNRAAGVFADVSILAVNYPSLAGFQPYGSHGGAVLISNLIGVAISGSDVASSNQAEVGSAVASTQRCGGNGTTGTSSSSSSSGSGLAAAAALHAAAQQAAAEGGLVPEATWRSALGALRRALEARCALLTIANTHLPMSDANSTQADSGGVDRPPLPAVWMEDLGASSLEARCSLALPGSSSGSGGGSSNDDRGIASISDMVQQSLVGPDVTAPAVAFGVPPPAAAAFAAAVNGSSSGDSGLGTRTSATLAELLQMLDTCVRAGGSVGSGSDDSGLEASDTDTGNSSSSSGSSRVAIGVSATHLRLANVTDALLLVNISGSVQPAFQAAVAGAGASSGAPGEPSAGSSSSSSSSAAIAGEAIAALLVAPGGRFGLRLQLHDGLGQPIAVDIPKYDVRLQLVHLDNATPTSAAAAGGTATAELRGAEYPVTTSYGVAAWDELEVYGWPGRYVLRAQASFSLDTVGPRAYPIDTLRIPLVLVPCEVGQELQQAQGRSGTASGGGGDSQTVLLTSCRQCRRDQLGLWNDTRPSLPSPLASPMAGGSNSSALALAQAINANANDADATAALLDALAGAANATRDLLGLSTEPGVDDACDACCVPCPDGATCAGGALLIPQPGYWHSAANSTALHACINPSACGDGWDDGEPWNESVEAALAATDPATLAWNQSRPALALAYAAVGIITSDARSRLLGSCQQWWYHNLPPQQSRAWAAASYAPRLTANGTALPAGASDASGAAAVGAGDPAPPWCQLYAGGDEPTSYLQLQCAEGYTGNMCATCEPGYTLSPDFDCSPCPSMARTVTLGVLAFLGTVFLILYTTFTNLAQDWDVLEERRRALQSEDEDQEEEDDFTASDVLKAIITHAQFYIIVTKLGISFPHVVTKYQAAMSAFTGAENYVAYSPTCLTPDAGPEGQAATAVAMGLLTPCVATALAGLLWTLRCLLSNQRDWFLINHAGHRPKSSAAADGATPRADRPLRAGATAGDGSSVGLSSSASGMCGLPSTATTDLQTMRSERTADRAPEALNADDGPAAAPVAPAPSRARESSGGGAAVHMLTPAEAAAAIDTADIQVVVLTPRLNGSAAATPRNAAAMTPTPPRPQPPPQQQQQRAGSNGNGSGHAQPRVAAPQAAPPGPVAEAHEEWGTSPMASPRGAGAHAASAPDGGTGGRSGGAATYDLLAPPTPRAAAAAEAAAPNGAAEAAAPALPAGFASSAGAAAAAYAAAASGRQSSSHAPADGDSVPQGRSMRVSAVESSGGRTPVGHVPSSVGGSLGRRLSWRGRLRAGLEFLKHPFRGVAYADYKLPWTQQLGVLLIVSSFILYPSLAQTSLAIFACYTLDTGDGTFPQNQLTISHDGWWLRNMNQRCYQGDHLALYLPIGVVAVVVFCVAPPLSYLLITVINARHKRLHKPAIQVQFGFLYQQYRRGWHWWGSARQLQTLAMVVVEVFGQAVSILNQSLLLLAVLIAIGVVNMACPAERSHVLRMLEFLSTSVLCLTITLSLYFIQVSGESLTNSAMAAVGIVIVVINVALIAGFVCVMFKAVKPKKIAKRVASAARRMSDTGARLVEKGRSALGALNKRALTTQDGAAGAVSKSDLFPLHSA
ncbi:hypothetical protein HXX76_010970 [Chlamydomonas incerta]|uniref:Right handed beta helix domain-containing protein n=1 Tax=Chlamydomonas incerta TaxID=51695 RepID=A0A835S9I0_CHLIN|nr:hypothetical protein HXX76_010970 [Chlamydomonas incerta]|eukprot:KAG2423202.1 hypothetical protein HXX76_010970 [Chlamydomonas incerta]